MKAIIGLVLCMLLGVSIGHQGWTALFWVPVGFGLGLFTTAQIVLPLILGLPRAIRLVAKGQMRPAVFGAIILTPVIWVVILAAAGFLVGWSRPAAAEYLCSNMALNLSWNLGIIAIILSPLSKKCRSDSMQDFDKAYRRFYAESHADVQFNLGVCYYNGDGVPKDYAEAVKWWHKAAEQNHSGAQTFLAGCYGSGYGVPKNEAEAIRWWRKAAEQNHRDAQTILAGCYAAGDGVPKDFVEAYMWANLAVMQGGEDAKTLSDNLEKKMTPEQIAEGKRRSREFKPRQ